MGQPVTGIWLGAAAQGEGAAVPSQVADRLRGREFKNFRAFREAFWRAVANDPELVKQFVSNNISEMRNGRSPFVRKGDRVGEKVKFELHHVTYVSKGGQVFDIDNVRIVTPKRHGQIHTEGK